MVASRLRPRFYLKTLLVVVTVACVWLGGQANIVRERKALRALCERNGFVFYPDENGVTQSPDVVRRLLGDCAIQAINAPGMGVLVVPLPPELPVDFWSQFDRLFPECRYVRSGSVLEWRH